MPSPTFLRALRPAQMLRTATLLRPYSSVHPSSSNNSGWSGRPAEEHVTRHPETPNAHAEASKAGKEERAAALAEGAEGKSQATTERDHGSHNKKAKEEHPEAPGPVIGMNDERGGVG